MPEMKLERRGFQVYLPRGQSWLEGDQKNVCKSRHFRRNLGTSFPEYSYVPQHSNHLKSSYSSSNKILRSLERLSKLLVAKEGEDSPNDS
ncbi:hypothetical protein C1H46_001616 [Malus baccata]|uniref:Uncharacterized protein n=1 Tax=Malus baccata TaxID=106549 RepID=A0A540NQ59_MALBA|nr:hypothetical protein C1H46_001616 [Malus baccata]